MYLFNSIYLLVWVIHIYESQIFKYIYYLDMYSTPFEEFSFIFLILNKMCFYQQNNKPKVRSGKK